MDDLTALESTLNQLQPQTLEFLRDLVGINSFTRNVQGINQNAERIIRQFAPFGFSVRRIQCENEGTGQHLVLDSGGDGPTIALISHLDTVYPETEEKANSFHWRQEGNTAYGPGVYDIKGGTAMIWMTLQALAIHNPEFFRSRRWLLFWNAAEEILTPHFATVAGELLPDNTKACLVFEGDSRATAEHSLAKGRKGRARFHIRVVGRGAHSGGAFAHGASAIHQIAKVIDRAMSLTELEKHVTVNVGTVNGGIAPNRVAHEAEALMEMRAFDLENYQRVRDQLLALGGEGDVAAPSDGFPCQVEIQLVQEIAPWLPNEGTEWLGSLWREAAACCGKQLDLVLRGGLSDGNWFWKRFPTMDGLGPHGGNAHVSESSADGKKKPEFVDLSSFVPKALINCLALQKL